MAIYEKFIGRSRESFSSYDDIMENFKIEYNDDFNFAYDVMDVLAKEKPDKRALVYVNHNRTEEKVFTFHDLMVWSNKTANFLRSRGIKKGDRLLFVLKRSYYFWFLMLGAHKIGAIPIQATNMIVGKDYTYRCNRADVKAVFITADGDSCAHFDAVEKECPTVEMKFVSKHRKLDGWIDFEKEIEEASSEWTRPSGAENTKATDTMFLAFSSGTTGYPKMIMHDFTYPLGHIVTGVFWHRVVDGGLHFTISDTGWLKSLWGKFYGQWFGESAVLVFDFDKFDGAEVLSVLEKYKVTTFCVPPTMYRFILQNDVKSYDLSSLKHCCSAGEALSSDIFNKWKEATGLEIYEGFGQTETTVCLGTLKCFSTPISGFIGKSMPGYNIKVLDSEGKEALIGDEGEISIDLSKGKPCGVTIGYFKDKEATEYSFRNGYFHTGDTGYIDEHGNLKYVGRIDDVIKSSGYRIGPFEVESVIMEHPSVLEVAVTGVPDEKRGFVVKATIVLKEGFKPSDELVLDIQNFVKNNTAPYKYPRIIEFVDSLPKTISGKIRRTEIRELDMKKYSLNK